MLRYLVPALLLAVPAYAECGTPEEAREVVKREYGEEPVFQAADDRGFVIEFLVSPDGKTYTAVIVKDGIACKIGQGGPVRLKPLPAAGKPS